MTEQAVSVVESGLRKVSRRAVVSASASEVFALVADPHRHPEIDGSGTVRDIPVKGPDRLSAGAKFSVGMTQFGVPYKITSKVTEFVPDRVIEWQHPLGHRWRWEFEPLGADSTQVTETFDYSHALSGKGLELMGVPKQNAAGITATLQALVARFAV